MGRKLTTAQSGCEGAPGTARVGHLGGHALAVVRQSRDPPPLGNSGAARREGAVSPGEETAY